MIQPIRSSLAVCTTLIAGALAACAPHTPPPAAGTAEIQAERPAADAGDVESIDAIITALYDVISGDVGEARDWDRMRSLFHPGATMTATGRTPAGEHRIMQMDVEGYIERNADALAEIGFVEREIGRSTDEWGAIAQVFSSYEAHRDGGASFLMRGINSLQLWDDGNRWWILSILWQQEDADMPIPERYLIGEGSVVERPTEQASRPVTTPSFAEAREAGAARLAFFHVPSSGFAYLNGRDRPTGVTAELLRDFAHFVAQEHGIDVEVAWLGEERWADFYDYVRRSEGGVFGIGNVTITEPRREEIAFSPPYMSNIAVLVTHTNVPEIGSLDEMRDAFQGLTALPYPGTLHETRLETIRDRYLPDVSMREVASNDELVALIASGEGYFGYMDVYNYWRAREAGAELRHHPVGDDASETFGVIMPRGTDWAPVMEAFFAADGGYVGSGRFRGLLEEHLGSELASLLADD